MADRRSARRRVFPIAVVVALTGFVVGCGNNEGVSNYSVPTPAKFDTPPPGERTGDYRILGGVFPADNPAWFFKFSGRADELAKHEAGFDQILQSVRFPKGITEPPEFDLPAGWTRGGPRDSGFIKVAETIRPPGSDLEITVTASGGELITNLDRWAVQQLGGAKIQRVELPKLTRPIETGPVKGLRVDLRGPNDPNAKKMPGRK